MLAPNISLHYNDDREYKQKLYSSKLRTTIGKRQLRKTTELLLHGVPPSVFTSPENVSGLVNFGFSIGSFFICSVICIEVRSDGSIIESMNIAESPGLNHQLSPSPPPHMKDWSSFQMRVLYWANVRFLPSKSLQQKGCSHTGSSSGS